MEAKRLYTLKDLKVGQVLTEVTREGDYKTWEVLGRDPKLDPKGNLYEKYIYVLDSWGRVEVRRWHVSDLGIKEVYEGFPIILSWTMLRARREFSEASSFSLYQGMASTDALIWTLREPRRRLVKGLSTSIPLSSLSIMASSTL